MEDLAIRNGSVWTGAGFIQADVHVRAGKFTAIGDSRDAVRSFDASGLLVLPGFIDPHVHFDLDLGRLRSADDFASGSVCALFGGVTTFADFLDPTDDPDALERSFRERRRQTAASHADYVLHATIRNPKGDPEAYVKRMLALGIRTLKLFTTYSDSGRRTYDDQIERLLDLSERYGFTILAHIEDDARITMRPDYLPVDLPRSRPAEGETAEALKLAGFVARHGGTLYMVHLSSGATLDALRAQFGGLLQRRFFVETCPHYLTLDATRLAGADGALYCMAPALRSADERRRLLAGFADVWSVGTDHCPFREEEKRHERLAAIPMGIGGVEHAFSVLHPLVGDAVIPKMTDHPARTLGLAGVKGVIAPGADADLALVRTIPHAIPAGHSRGHDLWTGWPTDVRVEATVLRGRFAVHDGAFHGAAGRYLRKEGSL